MVTDPRGGVGWGGPALLEWTLHTVEGICHLCTCQERESRRSRSLKAACRVQVRSTNQVLILAVKISSFDDVVVRLSDSRSANAGQKLRLELRFISQGKILCSNQAMSSLSVGSHSLVFWNVPE